MLIGDLTPRSKNSRSELYIQNIKIRLIYRIHISYLGSVIQKFVYYRGVNMIKIYLSGTPNSSPYIIGNGTIVREDYPNSNLFFRHKHNRTGWLSTGNIQVYEGYSWNNSYVTLKATGIYNGYLVQYELVYFNKYNPSVPLILVLLFAGTLDTKNKFYRLSNIKNDLGQSKNIEDLEDYTNEKDLLSALIEENDKISSILTYNIGLTKGENDTNKYNKNKINLKLLEISSEGDDMAKLIKSLTKYGFKIYTHKAETQNNSMKFCYTYENQFLMGQNKKPLEELNNKNYLVNVYFGFVDVPLMIEFFQSNSSTTKIYYYLSEKEDGPALWKKITKGSVLDVQFTNENIYEQLSKDDYKKLLELLDCLKNKFTKTIFFIIDRREGTYDNDDIERIVDTNKYNVINKNIHVRENKENMFKCIFTKGFRVIEHNFSQFASSIKNEKVEFKYIIPNSSGKDVILELYKGTDGKEIDNVIYFNEGNNKLYTYFYRSDPRPLLVCFNGKAYRPKDLNEYEFKWVKVEEINSWCNGNNKLLSTLNQVVCFLNVVSISEIPKSPHEISSYDVHLYNNKQIQINVTMNKLFGCYKSYFHEPSEEGYKLGNIEYKDNEELKGSITYDNKWDGYGSLIRVCVYYYNGDKTNKYPLLLILEFKDNNNFNNIFIYYKLTSTNYKWLQTYGINFDKNTLLTQLYNLNKRFNFNKIEYPEIECLEKSKHTGAIIGTVITSALVGGGLAIVFYLYPEVFFHIYKWLI